jgi:hypothetical protein
LSEREKPLQYRARLLQGSLIGQPRSRSRPILRQFREINIMTENVFTLPSDNSHKAILYGGLAVGVLDGMAAVILTLINGRNPGRMFQGIASGLIGRASLEGGWATVLLGVSLHVLIAFIWATIYYGASLRLPTLIRRPAIWGPIYGVVVYFAMQIIVLPLSAIRMYPEGGPPEGVRLSPFLFAGNLQGMLRQIIVHIICVGLPIAFFAWRSAKSD